MIPFPNKKCQIIKEKFAGKRKKSINRSIYYKPKRGIPFKKRISPEILAKIEENTKINNKYIKFYSTVDTKDDKFLVRDILKKSKVIKI